MTAPLHRAEAQKERAQAGVQMSKYDPEAVATRPRSRPMASSARVPGGASDYWPEQLYNPTERHAERAAEHLQHARQHEAAAAFLEQYESEACRSFPKETRHVCPLERQVSRIEPIERGIRVYVAPEFPLEAVLAHMKCHYAYGRARADASMEACPLYLADLQIRLARQSKTIEITSEDSAVVQELIRRALDLEAGE
jgi:hypothetical protein